MHRRSNRFLPFFPIICLIPSLWVSAGEPEGTSKDRIPAWTRDARWYYVDVAKFRNGQAANDPQNVQPWKDGTENIRPGDPESQYGGDLQGLQSRLPYLKRLEINALYLSGIFRRDMSHVRGEFGVKGSAGGRSDAPLGPGKERFTAGDQVFLDFLAAAHRDGFRVVVRAPAPPEESLAQRTHWTNTGRWLDPNGDGNPSDGIDGVSLTRIDTRDRGRWKQARARIKRVDPDAILILDAQNFPPKCLPGGGVDAPISSPPGIPIQRFFSVDNRNYTLKAFFDDLIALRQRYSLDALVSMLSAAGGSERMPLRPKTVSSSPDQSSGSPPMTQADRDRWRLATVFRHFYVGAPVTHFGDEVGMHMREASSAHRPMWWKDLLKPKDMTANYREDFLELVTLLHRMRQRYAPLRYGDFRPILLDGKQQILAFARTLPGDEVILVMNYGKEKRIVKIPTSQPRQLVGVLAPGLRRVAGRGRALPFGVNRQKSNERGDVSFWVKPMSIRIVLVNDIEPR